MSENNITKVFISVLYFVDGTSPELAGHCYCIVWYTSKGSVLAHNTWAILSHLESFCHWILPQAVYLIKVTELADLYGITDYK